MNSKIFGRHHQHVARWALMFAASLVMTSCSTCPMQLSAAPQTAELEEMMSQFGADPDMFRGEAVDLALRGWKFQDKLAKRQQSLIEDSIAELEAKLKELNVAKMEMREQLAEIDLPFPVGKEHEQHLRNLLRQTVAEKVAWESRLSELKVASTQMVGELKLQRGALKDEVALLEQKLALAKQGVEQAIAMAKKNFVSEQEVDKSRVQMKQVEVELHQVIRKMQNLESKIADKEASGEAARSTSQLASILEQIAKLKSQIKFVRQFDPGQKLETYDFRIDQTRNMIEMARVRQFELKLENVRNLAMIQLTNEMLAKRAKQEEDKSAARENGQNE